MDQQLKQRLIGVTIVVALVVIFVPMFFGEAEEGSSQSGVPPIPKEFMEQTLELPKAAEEVVVTKEIESSTPSESGYKIIPLTDAPENKSLSEEAAVSSEEPIETFDEEGGVLSAEKMPKPNQTLKKPKAEIAKVETLKPEIIPVKPKPGVKPLTDLVAKPMPETPVKPIYEPVAKPLVKQEAKPVVPVKPIAQPVQVPVPQTKPVQVMPSPDTAGSNVAWVIQTGSFTTELKARALTEKLRLAKFPAFMETVQNAAGTVYKVQVGPELDRGRAEQMQRTIETTIGVKGFIVPHQ